MNLTIAAAALFTLALAIALLLFWWRPRWWSRTREVPVFQRLLEVTHSATPRIDEDKPQQKLARLASSAAAWMRTHLGLRNNAGLRLRLARAGVKGDLPADQYLSARLLGPLAALLVAALASAVLPPSFRTFALIAFPALAYLAPDLLLERRIRRRRERIRRSIPDVMDLLVICVDAGLGLDQAILRVGQELSISYPDINEEFLHLNREQRAGRPRAEAWAGLAERVLLPDIDSFVNMLLQTERFGTPIAKALTTFAMGVRARRRQAAEELAAKTTIKIIFPLVFFIFPAIFLVLLGPAALRMFRGGAGF